MTTALLLDGHPVAFLGATRWYSTPHLAGLGDADRAAVAAVCDALVGDRRSSPAVPTPAAETFAREDFLYVFKAAFGRGRLRAARSARRPRRPTPGR